MLEYLQSFDLSGAQWVIALLCGVLVGFAKTGIVGLGMLVVPILAGIFEAKPSVGLLLPMLCIGDIFGVRYYNRHVEWKHLVRLIPWTLLGIGAGLFVGDMITGTQFKRVLAVVVIAGLGIMIWRERKSDNLSLPSKWWFAMIFGLAGGFATMIGNAAGSIMAIYLLSMNLPKYAFIGTRAWFFMIVNLIKVPLHLFIWGTITVQTLVFDATMLPAIALGAVLGVRVVKYIPERSYRMIIIILTAIAAVKILF